MATPVKRGSFYRKRRSGTLRKVAGFTIKPSEKAKSDGIRRARMVDENGSETRVRVDQLSKTYEYVY